MLIQARGFKYKFWEVLMTTASFQSIHGNIELILNNQMTFVDKLQAIVKNVNNTR
jgi:hypothetical protein